MEQPQSNPSDAEIFTQLDDYPWGQDEEFQAGLSAILGSATDPSQIEELTLRARCFYISRKKSIPVDFDAYKTHVRSHKDSAVGSAISASTPPTSVFEAEAQSSSLAMTSENPKYPTTFAEIVKLITEGKEIPGIKEIPSTVLHDKATQPTKEGRLKPWEKDIVVVKGTFGDRRDEVIEQEMPE